MNKYIDADKLIELVKEWRNKQMGFAWDAVNKVLKIIAALQQEQPKFKVGDTIHKKGENTVFPMVIERISDGDYVCVTEHQQSFINIKFQGDYELVEQEQPEVDIDKIIGQTYHDGSVADTSDMDHVDYENIARYFYELGLNARKEK